MRGEALARAPFRPYVVEGVPFPQDLEAARAMTEQSASETSAAAEDVRPPRSLSPAALRALAEAAERRAALDAKARELTRDREIDGRGGLEPVRYDDWEVKGIASDF